MKNLDQDRKANTKKIRVQIGINDQDQETEKIKDRIGLKIENIKKKIDTRTDIHDLIRKVRGKSFYIISDCIKIKN